jgi:hypothetical protein
LHGIQDLATHKGITNAQHSYLSKLFGRKDDPDHIEENRTKAREYSKKYIEFLRKKYSKSYKKLLAYEGRLLPWDKLMPAEKADLLNNGLGPDTPGLYGIFILSKNTKRSKKITQ